jgi:hypothetical protein
MGNILTGLLAKRIFIRFSKLSLQLVEGSDIDRLHELLELLQAVSTMQQQEHDAAAGEAMTHLNLVGEVIDRDEIIDNGGDNLHLLHTVGDGNELSCRGNEH